MKKTLALFSAVLLVAAVAFSSCSSPVDPVAPAATTGTSTTGTTTVTPAVPAGDTAVGTIGAGEISGSVNFNFGAAPSSSVVSRATSSTPISASLKLVNPDNLFTVTADLTGTIDSAGAFNLTGTVTLPARKGESSRTWNLTISGTYDRSTGAVTSSTVNFVDQTTPSVTLAGTCKAAKSDTGTAATYVGTVTIGIPTPEVLKDLSGTNIVVNGNPVYFSERATITCVVGAGVFSYTVSGTYNMYVGNTSGSVYKAEGNQIFATGTFALNASNQLTRCIGGTVTADGVTWSSGTWGRTHVAVDLPAADYSASPVSNMFTVSGSTLTINKPDTNGNWTPAYTLNRL